MSTLLLQLNPSDYSPHLYFTFLSQASFLSRVNTSGEDSIFGDTIRMSLHCLCLTQELRDYYCSQCRKKAHPNSVWLWFLNVGLMRNSLCY